MSRLLAVASSQFVEWPSPARLAFPISMAAWFRTTSLQGFPMAVSIGGGSTNYVVALTLPGGGNTAGMYVQSGTGGVWDAVTATTTVSTGVWAHAGGTHNGTTIAAYLNGGGKGTLTATLVYPGSQACTAAGRFGNQNQNYFDGRLAEVGMWAATLSDDEMLALARGVPPPRVRPGSLILYWPLWGTAAPEPDLSGNGRHGTVFNGATVADHGPVGR